MLYNIYININPLYDLSFIVNDILYNLLKNVCYEEVIYSLLDIGGFMKYFKSLLMVAITILSIQVSAGTFSGNIILFPEGCQNSKQKVCKLKEKLTYESDRKDPLGNKMVWQTAEGQDATTIRSGTTDGASIPIWAQPIIGGQYDMSYLKAAILHDHYCYEENQVRTWRETHRMFYDALIDLGVNKAKAKAMYFAVYWKGPRWTKIVSGDSCEGFGNSCIKSLTTTTKLYLVKDRYSDYGLSEKLVEIQELIENNTETSLEDLEKMADSLNSSPILPIKDSIGNNSVKM